MSNPIIRARQSHSDRCTAEELLELGREVMRTEAAAVFRLSERLGPGFVEALDLILECCGRVVVSGMGKSGHIGRKIAATLASTGTPAFFVHPGEASHGDLGMITADDVVLALSNSGESSELVAIVPLIKRRGSRLIAVTGVASSALATMADVHLYAGVEKEACPLGLAPTSSTTAALAMGDALAVALLHARGFSVEDFAMSHPGGRLGRRLLVRVADVMHSGKDVPSIGDDGTLVEALLEMSAKGLGMTAVVDPDNRIVGVFTDGDLRRVLAAGVDLRSALISDLMKRDPKVIEPERLAAQAVQQMEAMRINGFLVADQDRRLLGVFNMHDLLRAGVL